MPIAPTGEKKDGNNPHAHYHVDASAAVDAFIDLNAQCFVPMHYGTVFLSNASEHKNNLVNPVNRLKADWQERAAELNDKKLLFTRCGEQYTVA